jgi:hypothetical protein
MGYSAFMQAFSQAWQYYGQFLKFSIQSQPHLYAFSHLPFSNHWELSCYVWLFLIGSLSAELFLKAKRLKYFWHFEFGFLYLLLYFQDAFRFGRVTTVVYWLGLFHEISDRSFVSNYCIWLTAVPTQPSAYRSIWGLYNRFHQSLKIFQRQAYLILRRFHGSNWDIECLAAWEQLYNFQSHWCC